MKVKRRLQKILSILACLTLLAGVPQTVFASAAEAPGLGEVVDGSLLTDDPFSESILDNPVRGNILNQGATRITDKGNGVVNVYGAVFGSVVCDKLMLDMTLQRLQGGYWANVRDFSDVAYNQGSLAKSYNVSVAKGYYYRVKAACVAQKGSTVETKMPMTDGIWID